MKNLKDYMKQDNLDQWFTAQGPPLWKNSQVLLIYIIFTSSLKGKGK